jgi:group I intron endonuclease
MTRGQGDYSKSVIYKIVFMETGEFYIGSTRSSLRQRLHSHKKTSKNHPNRPLYALANQLGWDQARIVLVEEFPCENNDQLCRREQQHIEELRSDSCLNINSAWRSPEEKARQKNESRKNFLQRNPDYYKKRVAKWNAENEAMLKVVEQCACGGRYTRHGKPRHERSKMHQDYVSRVS